MTTFYLVRHAEKDGPPSLLSARAPGHGLTAAGREQARQLAGALAREPIRRVLSSPLARARETAAPLAQRLGLDVEVAAALTDIDYGEWTGRIVQELSGDARWQRHHAFRSGVRIPGGERLLETQARIVREMLEIASQTPDAAVALVSHGDPLRLALAWLAGAPLDFFDRFDLDYASVTTVTLTHAGPRIHEVNRRIG